MSVSDDQSSAKETLDRFLNETQSPDQETRDFAEQGIKSLVVVEEFGVYLTEILADSENELAVRLLASKTLQLYVESHWCNLFNEEFEFPEIKTEFKKKIKQLLPHELRDSIGEIRKAVAQIICAIAHWDWPENWPGLYDVLIDCLSQEGNFAIHEAMQVLHICIRYVDNTQLSNVGAIILQAMNHIFQDENKYSVLIRSQAVEIFTTIIGFILIPDYCGTDFVQQSVEPVLPMFCDNFMSTLKEKSETTSDRRLKTEVIKAIEMLTRTIPKCLLDFLPQSLPLIWETLGDSAKEYREHIVDREEDIDDEDTDSNGEVTSECDTLVKAIFDFISILISGPRGSTFNLSEFDLSNYQWFYLQDSLSPEAIQYLMIFMEFTDKQIDQWTNNPSQFLIEGEMDVNPNSIRGLARDLLIKIVGQPKRAAANALLVIILKQIQAEKDLRTSAGATLDSWKSHEATLLAFCIVKTIIVEKQKVEVLHFDVLDFLENVVLADATNSESHPLLVGRCLYLGGIYADQMPSEMMSRFLKATANSLEGPLSPGCVKICAATAANSWFRTTAIEEDNVNENILSPHLPAIFKGLFDLGSRLMSAEGLKLILESFAILVSLDKKFTVSVESNICALTIAAFLDYYNDFSILWVCKKIIRELSLNPECMKALQARLIPKLVDMMSENPSNKPESGKVALDILHVLVEHSPQPLSSLLIETAFPASCNCIVTSDNHATLQSGSKVVRTYFSMGAQQVISFKDNDNKTGSQYILKVAGKLLGLQSSNFRVEDACELVESLIKTAAITSKENIDTQRLLAAVLRKMECTERIFTRRLLLVFAYFINTQLDMVLDFLHIVSGAAGQNTLTRIVSDGFCKEHKFFDNNDRKIVNLALSKILEHGVGHNESKLHGRADAQAAEDEARTNIPLLVEICKVITSEL